MTEIGRSPSEPETPLGSPSPSYADRLVKEERVMRGDQAAAEARRPYRSAATRAKALVVMLWVSLGSSLIASALNVWGWLTIDAFIAGRAELEDLDTFDIVFARYALIEIAIFVAAAVAWLAWQSRTVDNEGPLGIGPSPWSPVAAMVWWFVPIANLFMPYRIHRDMWRRYVGIAGGGLVLWWWLAWLASTLVSNAAGRVWLIVDTLDTIQAGLLVWLVADILAALAAIPAIALVVRIQRRAEALASARSESVEPPAAQSPTVI